MCMSENDDNSNNGPRVIPFDDVSVFSRNVPFPPKTAKNEPPAESTRKPVTTATDDPSQTSSSRSKALYDRDERPVGYSNDENDDDSQSPMLPQEEVSPLIQMLKDIYVPSPFDSTSRRDAKFVVRNITLLSVLFGVIFTIIWYAFPGSFVYYKANTQFTSRYPTVYVNPDELLSTEFTENGGVFFDDEVPQGNKISAKLSTPSPNVPLEKTQSESSSAAVEEL